MCARKGLHSTNPVYRDPVSTYLILDSRYSDFMKISDFRW